MLELMRDRDKRWQRWRNPKGRRVLVDARRSMEYAMIAPVHKAMQSDPRVTFFFMSSEEPSRASEIYREAGDVTMISSIRAALMQFDAYIAADLLWATLPRGTRRIQMFHGVAGKYGNLYDRPERSMRDWHRLFFINRRRLESHIAVGAIDADSPAARLIGMPKVDCLVDGSLHRNNVLIQLGIDPGRPTVLYAPTWTPYSSLNAMGEELVERLGKAGYSVMVKLHDHSRDPEYVHSGGIDWGARLERVLRRSGGYLAIGSNACPYLAAADVMITDHSSVGFEYLLLDRPLIRIEMPELIARTNIHPDYVRLLADASTTVRNVSQAIVAVEHGLVHISERSSMRKAVVEDLFYKPGTATERAVHDLYEVLELDARHSAATKNNPNHPKSHI
jgi:hypothetical protein